MPSIALTDAKGEKNQRGICLSKHGQLKKSVTAMLVQYNPRGSS